MISPRIKWLSQRDNINAWTGEHEAYNQCMVSSFVMIHNWLREYMMSLNQPTFEYYDEVAHYIVVGETKEKVQKVRFNSINHVKKLNYNFEKYKIKIPYRFAPKNFTYDEVVDYVYKQKRPVLIGTMETSAGHILCFDGQFQNPYGRPEGLITNSSCKYKDVNGANLDYSKDFAESMVFRQMVNGKTSAINVKRPCWIIEG